MASDSSAVDAALVATLSGDATLAALCPGGVFFDVAPEKAEKFVIVSQVVHLDHYSQTGTAYEEFVYLVKAVVKDASGAIVKDAAAAGKQIFCEKPLALDLAEIDEALACVNAAGVKLQVGFNRRFDKSFQRVHEIVASGEIGRPCILRITNRDPDFPAMEFLRASGGIFLDLAIHDFDMVRYQVGEVDAEIQPHPPLAFRADVLEGFGFVLDPAMQKAGEHALDEVARKPLAQRLGNLIGS